MKTRIDDTSDLLLNVTETFPAVASCSGLSSLEAAASGVSSAKIELDGELIVFVREKAWETVMLYLEC